MFKPVTTQIDFPTLEREILAWWYSSGLVDRYLSKNSHSPTKFSFLDGPITANNPMGVHHAWGRSFKDLWLRYHTLKGDACRYQNGFDCQGLWVEVEVEKELGFKSKKDIETFGVANFVDRCKERVLKYSSIQTEQSKRLGYFMDWNNSYYTMSDDNNYAIWNFLKVCWQKGWIYKGHESVPWCPRCETAISQHEMLTEDYKELTHESVYIQFKLVDAPDEYLLVWTTTPWTIPANIAIAVDEKIDYVLVQGETAQKYWVAKAAKDHIFPPAAPILASVKGIDLVGKHYLAPFDDLKVVRQLATEHPDKFHVVIPTDSQIMPIDPQTGTGLVHTAVSAGAEDFKLGQKLGLPMIPVIADNADYLPLLDYLAGKNAKKHPEIILDHLRSAGWAFKIFPYTHRYPACWRCKAELVWKVADEWYIAMDTPDTSDKQKRTYRAQMIEVAKHITWLPEFGLERELDWLNNMHDWLISKKNRYWGLALPIYECACGHFDVIGSKAELQSRATSGWDAFAGHTPHKPWIDEVKIACSRCGQTVSRVNDVGNVWLDAGIVPFSTLPGDWFPADFITESFPGQFKNWFYAMIAMSAALTKTNPFKTVLGFATLLAEDGRPMHKSWGNFIEFNEGADKIGVDVMRWMYATHDPSANLLFGYKIADETRRRFHLTLWNIYNFFLTYAIVDKFDPAHPAGQSTHPLDVWIKSRLAQTTQSVTQSLDGFDAFSASRALEEFVSDLSLWYVRRSRDRVGPTAQNSPDKTFCHSTLHQVLTTLCILLAPFTPFLAESMYKNLTGRESVHLETWPQAPRLTKPNLELISHMRTIRKAVELGLSIRKTSGVKVRQPLAQARLSLPSPLSSQLLKLLSDELNVHSIEQVSAPQLDLKLDTNITPELEAEGQARQLIRDIQELRKASNAGLTQRITVNSPFIPTNSDLVDHVKNQTLADSISPADQLSIELVG
jgi:isoleucyl-tRNA synthetase